MVALSIDPNGIFTLSVGWNQRIIHVGYTVAIRIPGQPTGCQIKGTLRNYVSAFQLVRPDAQACIFELYIFFLASFYFLAVKMEKNV